MFKKVFKVNLIICLILFSANCFGSIGVEVTPNSWDVTQNEPGGAGAGTWISPAFTVQNPGTDPAKVNIRGTNTQNWTIETAPGLNIFAMQWGTEPNWNNILTNDTVVVPSLAGSTLFNFNLRYQSPLSVTDTGLTTTQTSVVTVSAVSPVIIIGVWDIQTVDTIGHVGIGNSNTLDSSGNTHISYYDYTNADLRYAKWNGSSWDIQTVDTTGDVGWWSSIALDVNNYPHISYLDRTNSDLKYARWTGTEWDIQTVESAGAVGGNNSIVLDSNGYAHISYKVGNTIKYAKWNGSSWDIQTVDSWSGLEGSGENSITIDTNGYPHISYHAGYIDGAKQNLRYARWTGIEWNIQTVDSSNNTGRQSSIALDINNYPHISYCDGENYDLRYAKWNGSSWDIQTVDSESTTGFYSSIDIDSNNHPHISYHGYGDLGSKCVRYAKWTGTEWDIQTVDLGGTWGTSLVLDINDCPHISYDDDVNEDLKYAVWK